jgi:coenzyme F420 hydrogenase subunit beta
MKSIIEKIKEDGLCLGCGLCESICGEASVKMNLEADGFFRPDVKIIDHQKERIVQEVCPGVNVVNDLTFKSGEHIWGMIEQLHSGYSNDKTVRKLGSSGGIVSSIGIFMLEKGMVDAVLQVGGSSEDYERNSLKISKTREDVLQCASSRYAPALIFDKIIEILEVNNDTYCFIGKPCDISGLKNLFKYYPQYKDRFKLSVSILCAGMPSFKGTKAIIDDFRATKPVRNLVYRGNGWPGYFSFTDSDDRSFQKSYNDSWGKTLNQHLNFRCKICPDGIGLQADIAVGDAWETKNGYPDFTEQEGQSLIIARTQRGATLLQQAQKELAMVFQPLEEDKLALMQPYQYARRKRVAARVMAFTLGKRRLLNYKNISLWRNIVNEKPTTLLREFIGTFKRIVRQ